MGTGGTRGERTGCDREVVGLVGVVVGLEVGPVVGLVVGPVVGLVVGPVVGPVVGLVVGLVVVGGFGGLDCDGPGILEFDTGRGCFNHLVSFGC